jgi:hypothetical protein
MKIITYLLLFAFLSIPGLHAQTRSGTQASRLVAWAQYIDFYVIDSGYYTYTGSNGGDLTHLLNFSNETIYSYSYNTGADSFANAEDVLESFDGNGYKTDSLTQYWDSTTWVNDWRTLFNYDANNHDTLAYYQTWDSTKWIGSIETFYHYTNNKIDTVTAVDTSYLGGWVNNTKKSFAYNSSTGYITDEVIQYWNLTNNSWSSFYNVQFQYYYDSFNNDTAWVIQDYDTVGAGSWVNAYKVVYTYDTHHNPITEVDLVWNTTVLDTETKFKTLYKYDANSNDTSSIELQYNYNTLVWDTVETNSYTYNSYNQVTYHKSFNVNLFVPYSEIKYYYSDTATGVKQLPVNSEPLSVYPNPSSNFIHLTLILQQVQPVLLSLYNVLGQQVWSVNMGNATRVEAIIPVTNLVNGVYILKVNSGNTSQQKEIVVTR